VAGGIAPSPLAEAGGLPTGPDGRVQVPPDPTADGLPGVHVPGDLAAIPG
jgi:NADH dehydrogenase FAD-containing subunit